MPIRLRKPEKTYFTSDAQYYTREDYVRGWNEACDEWIAYITQMDKKQEPKEYPCGCKEICGVGDDPNCEYHGVYGSKLPKQEPSKEKLYPCDGCGKMRTKAEGGTTFTVCDECWGEKYPKQEPSKENGNCQHQWVTGVNNTYCIKCLCLPVAKENKTEWIEPSKEWCGCKEPEFYLPDYQHSCAICGKPAKPTKPEKIKTLTSTNPIEMRDKINELIRINQMEGERG